MTSLCSNPCALQNISKAVRLGSVPLKYFVLDAIAITVLSHSFSDQIVNEKKTTLADLVRSVRVDAHRTRPFHRGSFFLWRGLQAHP